MSTVSLVNTSHVESEVLSGPIMKSSLFWDIRTCSQLIVNQRFGGTCCLHLQGWKISQAINQHVGSSNQSRALLAVCFNPASSNLEGAGRNVSRLSKDFAAVYPRTQDSSIFHIFSLTLLLWLIEDKKYSPLSMSSSRRRSCIHLHTLDILLVILDVYTHNTHTLHFGSRETFFIRVLFQ